MASSSIPVLKGKAAEQFLEYNEKQATAEDLKELQEAEDFYLSKCTSNDNNAHDKKKN